MRAKMPRMLCCLLMGEVGAAVCCRWRPKVQNCCAFSDVLIDTSAQGVYFRRLVSVKLKPLHPASPELWKLWFISQIYQDICSVSLSTATFLL